MKPSADSSVWSAENREVTQKFPSWPIYLLPDRGTSKPAFYSMGMDCFGPFFIKIGCRNKKRWGVVFKCMTIRAVHLDILHSIDSDSFLMALRRFIIRRGKPYKLLCDLGCNFKGGERELSESFAAMQDELQSHLAS